MILDLLYGVVWGLCVIIFYYLHEGSRDVSNSSDASTFLKNWTQSKGFGKKLYIQYGKPLPAETLQAFGIRKPESSLESPALVLSTAPFSYGKVDTVTNTTGMRG